MYIICAHYVYIYIYMLYPIDSRCIRMNITLNPHSGGAASVKKPISQCHEPFAEPTMVLSFCIIPVMVITSA